jgi:hypothetical protein
MPVQCFGRAVTCVHCGGEFQASEQSGGALPSFGLPTLPSHLPPELAQVLVASEMHGRGD